MLGVNAKAVVSEKYFSQALYSCIKISDISGSTKIYGEEKINKYCNCSTRKLFNSVTDDEFHKINKEKLITKEMLIIAEQCTILFLDK
jgi:hypothetical protein